MTSLLGRWSPVSLPAASLRANAKSDVLGASGASAGTSAGDAADGLKVPRLDKVEGPIFANRSAFHPERPRTQSGEHWVVVARGNDDSASRDDCFRPLLEELPELVIERLVHLVEEENLWRCLLGDREA